MKAAVACSGTAAKACLVWVQASSKEHPDQRGRTAEGRLDQDQKMVHEQAVLDHAEARLRQTWMMIALDKWGLVDPA